MSESISKSPKPVVAIDPGTSKCGIAVVEKSGEVRKQTIIENKFLAAQLEKLLVEYNPELLVIGNGTGSEAVRQQIVQISIGIPPIEIVDEKGSTEEARKNKLKNMSFLQRFVSLVSLVLGFSRLVLDDEVAVILAKRYFNEKANLV